MIAILERLADRLGIEYSDAKHMQDTQDTEDEVA